MACLASGENAKKGMNSSPEYDAVVVGSGPNGLSAAIRLTEVGKRVFVVEAHDRAGGGARTTELTLPGFHHDVCSAIHPMGLASPYLSRLPLEEHGLEWIQPSVPLAHPFENGEAVAMFRSVAETAAQFDPETEKNYIRLFSPLVDRMPDLLGDLLAPPGVPSHPVLAARFGMRAFPSALELARAWLPDEMARGLYAGNAAHSVLPLDRNLATGAIGLMLMLVGHAYGWPIARGGSGKIIDAMLSLLEQHGGTVETGRRVRDLGELPSANAYLFDTSPSELVRICREELPHWYREQLRVYRHGPGVFKIDYALSEAVPWNSELCGKAGTVHLGASLDEISISEREAWEGRHCERPFVLTAQQSLCDPSRAPEGKHTFWAYCHVPSGSTVNMTERIENQIERFAPGFRDCVLARHTMNCDDYERYNPNLIGGDIVGGVADWRQLLTRPVPRWRPHTTPHPKIFLCSSSTPPGGGVHGMCGYWAAEEVLRDE